MTGVLALRFSGLFEVSVRMRSSTATFGSGQVALE